MTNSSVSAIKRAQKQSVFLREISKLFMQIAMDDPKLQNLTVSRVELSPDKSLCKVYFYTSQGKEHLDELLGILKQYKPAVRKALASTIQSRYVPDLVFEFDSHFEKQMRIEKLLDTVKTED